MLLIEWVFPKVYFSSQALYLAISPKSNSVKSIFKAIDKFKNINHSSVPEHLKNNSTKYKNPHKYDNNWIDQEYLPDSLKGVKFWEPNNFGWEIKKYEELIEKRKS